MATINVRHNGSYLVEGDDTNVVDRNGAADPVPKGTFALCRWGGSTNKPFRDGTHTTVGFAAAEPAVGSSQDRPYEWRCYGS
jgi:CDGSH-type Zn-finger protein